MRKISLNSLHQTRKDFIEQHKNKDHVYISGNNNILISSPHGVSQLRLGKLKQGEIGSLATALFLKNNSKCHLIAKTKNNNDDANFDEESLYKDAIRNIIQKHNIKYIIDIHGLAAFRECDINLGTHLGKNIENNLQVFENLQKLLEENNFITIIDQPFMAGSRTISGSMKNEFENIWTIQIEINCKITNKKENIAKLNTLLSLLLNWINSIQ